MLEQCLVLSDGLLHELIVDFFLDHLGVPECRLGGVELIGIDFNQLLEIHVEDLLRRLQILLPVVAVDVGQECLQLLELDVPVGLAVLVQHLVAE